MSTMPAVQINCKAFNYEMQNIKKRERMQHLGPIWRPDVTTRTILGEESKFLNNIILYLKEIGAYASI